MNSVSVIIPVFNAAIHLEECINSLLKQTFKDCEFIFINDGSTDNSQKIIEKFQTSDSRIILFNQENKGVSQARNKGLELSNCEYIGFVDADDFIKDNYFETLYNELRILNSDIVVSDFSTETNGIFITIYSKFKINKPFNQLEIKNELLPEFIKNSSLNSVCNKLYKSTIIKNCNFPVGTPLGEDGIFNMQAFSNSSSILFIDYAGYFYKEVQNSATKNILKNDFFQRALNVYHFNYESYLTLDIPEYEIQKWKSVRLLENVVSLIHIYFSSKTISFLTKINTVKTMITCSEVQHSTSIFYNDIVLSKSHYQKLVVKFIKLKSVFLLFITFKYSQFRSN